ncbi:Leucine-rich repeat protein kinase family protein [Rhynchospora pubera]|uniref:Leucine-rich repeat protein kinase family protein n=1 Tax=Rhynchospora pubera TaxID=906938 RepID=A0AAV8DJR9_9POAL|nr:Leucine-rich repeat protein kinase family protein [Rhynchospora pubera]
MPTAMAPIVLLLSQFLSLLTLSTSTTTPAAPVTAVGDTAALILFRENTDTHGNLAANWTTADACTGGWVGITCWGKRVVSVSLPSLDLRGPIDTLSHLDQLRVLDLHSNRLNGTLSAISSLQNLKLIYLSHNDFSGEIPPAISQLTRLLRIDLSNNNLRGPIPGDAVANLTHLLTFRVQDNLLSGLLPDLSAALPRLVEFNASNNQLSGRVPDGMHAKFGIQSFGGNGGLCGPFPPLPLCSFIPHEPPPSIVATLSPSSQSVVPSNPASASSSITSNGPKKPIANTERGGLSKGAIIGIAVGNICFLFLIISLLTVYCCCSSDASSNKQKKGSSPNSEGDENQKGEQSTGAIGRFSDGAESDGAQSKLVFFGLEGDEEGNSDSSCEKRTMTSKPTQGRRKFELEELLRASAEMVGKGSLGTVYRAVLEDGRMVAVKRLRDTNPCPSKDFYRYMDLIGRLRHPNLVRLRAFYYAKQEKLLIYDFLPNGTLHFCLHANRGPGRVPLDWTARFKLLLGAARGLAWIHQEYSVSGIPHGNIKSSNILIDSNHDACIADFGLSLLLSPAHAIARLGSYMAPEQSHSKRLSQEADVYSFGVLILEALTGKVPTQHPPPLADSTSQKKHNKAVGVASVDASDVGLVEWVRLVVREEWTAEVFDVELLRYKDIEEEMVSMLHVGLACVNQLPENRPSMPEVVKLIEAIRVEDQSTLSPSIAAMTDDGDNLLSC